MEKKQRASFVSLTDGEYIYLLEKYGERELGKRIGELSKKKIENPAKQQIKSDFRAIISEGMKVVEPIRDKYMIEQMKQALMHQSKRNWFLFVMGINTGLRISDLLKLRVKDVRHKTHIELKEEKTKKLKRFLLNLDLRRTIIEYTQYMEDEDYLFPSKKTDLSLQRVQAYKILRSAAEQVGLEHIGSHTCRKTFGYWHYQTYRDIALLQNILNHSHPSITLKYIGINQEMMDKSLENFSL
ncbi:tyrosine-type recombinase/integrase [Microbacteriaceae bacterium 4G12]